MNCEEMLEAQRAVDVLKKYEVGSHILHKDLYREIVYKLEGKGRDFRDLNKKIKKS